MEPMTMPAMAPPVRLVPPSSGSSITTVVTTWRAVRIRVKLAGVARVGVSARAGAMANHVRVIPRRERRIKCFEDGDSSDPGQAAALGLAWGARKA